MRRDWLLIALDGAGDNGLSPVQVQKTMFVFWKGAERRLGADEFYNFEAYNFGPFDASIYQDLERMEMEGLCRILNPRSTAARLYLITDTGRDNARRLRSGKRSTCEYVDSVVQWVRRKSFPELLRAIYRKWPEYRRNSIFAG